LFSSGRDKPDAVNNDRTGNKPRIYAGSLDPEIEKNMKYTANQAIFNKTENDNGFFFPNREIFLSFIHFKYLKADNIKKITHGKNPSKRTGI
jgi:hypothetical protein